MNAVLTATPKTLQTLHDDAGWPIHGSGSSNVCKMCSAPHNLDCCPDFKCLAVADRVALVQNHGLCMNCLCGSHTADECTTSVDAMYARRSS